MSKGFVTIATGSEHYFELAANLLASYKRCTKNRYPFAIITDHKNKYTELFDCVIILENPQNSYMDKIEMLSTPPFDDNIFIDADSLAYGDLNELFAILSKPEGVTCFGKTLDLFSEEGWYTYNNLGKYRTVVKNVINLHGGIMFFKNGKKTEDIYNTCKEIANDYHIFNFKYFLKPADEPIIALSMAINNCSPVDFDIKENRSYLFLPTAKKFKADITHNYLSFTFDGIKWHKNVILLHFQNQNTFKALYKNEVRRMHEGITLKNSISYFFCQATENILNLKQRIFSIIYKKLSDNHNI